MKSKKLLLIYFLVTLIGCTTQLRPSQYIHSYYVTTPLQQSPTLLCGLKPEGEACLIIVDGPKVKTVINGQLSGWLPSLLSNKMTMSALGRSAYLLPKEQGEKLLQALVSDFRHREFERWTERYNDDDRLFDRL